MSAALISRHQDCLRQVYARHLGHGSFYALVDFPDHPNVGDSAIWLGELTILRAITGREPAYVSTWHDFDRNDFSRSCPEGPLLIHGGGNLGDLWSHHQQFREQLLTEFPDRTIVQLPQSIFFRNGGAAGAFADIAIRHPDFTLYVRDDASLRFARSVLGLPARLAPDSAMMLNLERRAVASEPILALMRTDWERVDGTPDLPIGAKVVDWLEDEVEMPTGHNAASREAQALARLRRGVALLSQAQHLITDRLHGHILALLMGLSHEIRDNSYGKLSAYASSWNTDVTLSREAV
jgi:exopolysaccharide biosynthesis predicted pyruvyltransferase EpsI